MKILRNPFAEKSDKVYYEGLHRYRLVFRTGVPAFCYHKVGPVPKGALTKSIFISEQRFSNQMGELADAGFTTASLNDLPTFTNKNNTRFVITFDDGSRSVLEKAVPILSAHNFHAIQFLVSGQIGGTNAWDIKNGEIPDPLMNKDEIQQWLALGHEIGAHTVTHPRLPEIPHEQAREEISASKKQLEDLLQIPIRHFCYPYGAWNRSIVDLVQEAGYDTAVSLIPGVNVATTTPHLLKRLGARPAPFNFRSFFRLLAKYTRI